jgi:hypothetical protein
MLYGWLMPAFMQLRLPNFGRRIEWKEIISSPSFSNFRRYSGGSLVMGAFEIIIYLFFLKKGLILMIRIPMQILNQLTRPVWGQHKLNNIT